MFVFGILIETRVFGELPLPPPIPHQFWSQPHNILVTASRL
jgi:hypothetical protein